MLQEPWLDSNGNGIANEPEGVTLASRQRTGFTAPITEETWPPYIVSAVGPSELVNHRGTIQAVVRDNKAVRRVWAVIYPPSYRPPTSNVELVPDTLPTIVLHKGDGENYRGEYPGFDEQGSYRIAIYAEDDDGLVAQPTVIDGPTSEQMYMPYLQRSAVQPATCTEPVTQQRIWQGNLTVSCDLATMLAEHPALKLESTTPSIAELYSPLLPVEPNTVYRVSYAVKTNLTVQGADLYGRVIAAQYTSMAVEDEPVDQNRVDAGFGLGESVGGTRDWATKSYTFTTGATTHFVRLRGVLGGPAGTAQGAMWVTNIQLTAE